MRSSKQEPHNECADIRARSASYSALAPSVNPMALAGAVRVAHHRRDLHGDLRAAAAWAARAAAGADHRADAAARAIAASRTHSADAHARLHSAGADHGCRGD